MFNSLKRRIYSTALTVLMLAFLAGCGADRAPSAPNGDAFVQTSGDQGAGGGALQPAAKRGAKERKGKKDAGTSVTTVDASLSTVYDTHYITAYKKFNGEPRIVSCLITPEAGGVLKVVDRHGGTEADDLSIGFKVPSGGVAEEVPITMEVYGNLLSELVVVFEPAGLVFINTAVLEVRLGYELVDMLPEEFMVYHKYADGTVEETAILSLRSLGNDTFLRVQAEVPGFSRYGLRKTSYYTNCNDTSSSFYLENCAGF